MHPLRVLLLASLVVAAAVAVAFGAALLAAEHSRAESIILGLCVFAAFLVPWGGVFAWAVRRASDLEELTDRSKALAGGASDEPIADREYHGELDDLARSVEELRAIILRQRADFEQHREAIDQIVASLGEGLLAVGPKGRVVFANSAVAEMFGVAGPLIGRTYVEVIRQKAIVQAFDKALRGETLHDRITVGSHGAERQIEVRVVPVAGSGEIAAAALFIDITRFERLQRIRQDFVEDFSHEVRTPLAGLRSAVETFEQGGLTAPQEEQLRGVMTRQLARLERLVRDLSELHRIESGELVLERRTIDLHELLRDLCDDFRERLSGRPVTFTLRGGETPAAVDPDRVQQIFVNLLDNAWKHGGGRGEIVVEVGVEGDEAVVRVSDEGTGIPPHELTRIFHRFYRVDKSREQNAVSGVGLGLAIAKHLVLLHGGSIRAFNREEGGATFEVKLPNALL